MIFNLRMQICWLTKMWSSKQLKEYFEIRKTWNSTPSFITSALRWTGWNYFQTLYKKKFIDRDSLLQIFLQFCPRIMVQVAGRFTENGVSDRILLWLSGIFKNSSFKEPQRMTYLHYKVLTIFRAGYYLAICSLLMQLYKLYLKASIIVTGYINSP